MSSMYDDPCGPMPSSDWHLRKLETQLEDAQHDGDEEAAQELLEVIQEHKDWLCHCQEKQWEHEQEDARFESHWEAMV